MMKRPKLLLLILLVLLLGLTSCSSFSDLVRSQVEGVPSWVFNPQVRNNQTAYVGRGVNLDAYNARLLAFEDILSQISKYVGEDIREAYYRELTTTNAITDFSLVISNEYTKQEDPRSPSQVYLLARLDTQKLIGRRTKVYNEMLQRDKQIDDLLSQADSAYRSNNDIRAIKLYCEAALVSASGSVSNKNHESDALLQKARTFVSALKFSLNKSEPDKAHTTVYVRRKSRLLAPKVLNAPVKAEFQVRNSLGKTYTDFLQFNTSSNGYFAFVPYNFGLISNGSVRFTVDLTSTLTSLEKVFSAVQLASLEGAIDSLSIDFPYSLASPVGAAIVAADIQEFMANGTRLVSSNALRAFAEEMAFDQVAVRQVDLQSEEVDGQIAELKNRVAGATYLFSGSVGVAKEAVAQSYHAVVVSGSVRMLDAKTGEVLFDTKDVQAVGIAQNSIDARDEAFRRFAKISAYLSSAHLLKQ